MLERKDPQQQQQKKKNNNKTDKYNKTTLTDRSRCFAEEERFKRCQDRFKKCDQNRTFKNKKNKIVSQRRKEILEDTPIIRFKGRKTLLE